MYYIGIVAERGWVEDQPQQRPIGSVIWNTRSLRASKAASAADLQCSRAPLPRLTRDWRAVRRHSPDSASHGNPAFIIDLQSGTRIRVIIGLPLDDLSIWSEDSVAERVRPVLV